MNKKKREKKNFLPLKTSKQRERERERERKKDSANESSIKWGESRERVGIKWGESGIFGPTNIIIVRLSLRIFLEISLSGSGEK